MTSATGLGLILSLLMSMLLWMGGHFPHVFMLIHLKWLCHSSFSSTLLRTKLRYFYRKSSSCELSLFGGLMMVNVGGSFLARPVTELHHCMDHSIDALILAVQLQRRRKRTVFRSSHTMTRLRLSSLCLIKLAKQL